MIPTPFDMQDKDLFQLDFLQVEQADMLNKANVSSDIDISHFPRMQGMAASSSLSE
jgi:hypothetical protein